MEPAAVHVQQHPAEALNISNERELMELQDDTLEADMEHPTKICRVCGIGIFKFIYECRWKTEYYYNVDILFCIARK